MRERWMVDRARDRLIESAVRMQRLRDELRCGMLRPDQADEACSVVLAQLENARGLLEEASASLRAIGSPDLTEEGRSSGIEPARNQHRRPA
jgi:hypothetical protein